MLKNLKFNASIVFFTFLYTVFSVYNLNLIIFSKMLYSRKIRHKIV